MIAAARRRPERDGLHVSASAIRTLQECGREWWYQKVEGRPPEDVPTRLVLGVAVHEALAVFYSAMRDGKDLPSTVDLARTAGASMERSAASGSAVAFAEGEGLDTLEARALGLLTAFMASGYRPQRVLAVEEPFALILSDPETGEVLPYEERVVGVIDLVAEDDGRVVVVDHKTAARSDRQKGERADTQMGFYSWAAKQILGEEEVELRYQNVIKTKVPKVEVQPIELQRQDEREAIEAAAGAIELIHVAITHPNGKRLMSRRRSWRCRECGYRRHCGEDRT